MPRIEPDIRVNFRKPWVIIATLIIVALILAAVYYLAGPAG
jgi:hypothetical protein